MTFRLSRTQLAFVALAGLLALAPWTPTAAAAGPPVRVDELPTLVHASCATGEITYSAGASRPGDRHLALEGWIEPCAVPESPAGFGVMRYYTTQANPSFFSTVDTPLVRATYPLYPYDPSAPRTQFTFDFVWTSEDRLRALCVARSVDAPVACVAVELSEDAVSRRFTTIPVDDPRITSVPVRLDQPGGDSGHPACGNCV